MYKNSRVELGSTLMILKSENKVCGMDKQENGAQILNIDCGECEQGLSSA